MSLDKIFDNIEKKSRDQIRRGLNSLFRSSSKYKNLDQGNREVLFEVVDKLIDKKKKFHTINSMTIRSEMSNLRGNMSKNGLTHDDLKDIEEIISELKN